MIQLLFMDINDHPKKPEKVKVTTDDRDELFVVASSLLAIDSSWRNEFRVSYWRATSREFPHDITMTRHELGNIATGPKLEFPPQIENIPHLENLRDSFTVLAADTVGTDRSTT